MPYYGFNMLWMFVCPPDRKTGKLDEKELDFIAKHGFNFIRIPTDYNYWTRDFDYTNPDEKVFELIDSYIQKCNERGLHASLNIHRAPGYCINRNDLERDNLWADKAAQDGFTFMWETFAKRYKGISSRDLSFDLLNEPPNEGQYGFTREIHSQVMRRVIKAIRSIDPQRDIVIDGLGGGHLAMPEMADAGVIHSGRGYTPFAVSHYQAGWCGIDKWPEPVYPGEIWGEYWDRAALEKAYAPWREVEDKGVKVHMGEFGCFNKTPNDIALRWLGDLMSVWRGFGWGYSMWNFKGAFGIIEHGRPGAKYEEIDGFKVDRELMEIMKANMV